MTNTISYTTKSRKEFKNVEIDGEGFKVRKLGAGEQLSISQLQRRVNKLSSLENITEEQEDEILECTDKLFTIMEGIFDDGGDQSKTKSLMQRIDPEELGILIEKIFSENEQS